MKRFEARPLANKTVGAAFVVFDNQTKEELDGRYLVFADASISAIRLNDKEEMLTNVFIDSSWC